MKKQVYAAALAAVLAVGPAGLLPEGVLADTAVIEEDMEEVIGEEATDWKLKQTLSASVCRRGKDVTLSVSLTGGEGAMQLSTIYAHLKYDPKVFQIDERDVTPTRASQADYITFDRNLGEADIYYAGDISVESGTTLLKLTFHARSDAKIGVTKLGVEELELYATDSDDYAVIENAGTLKVTIQKSASAVSLGDVNGDKKVNLTDVKLIMKYCNDGTRLTAAQKKNADVNRDGHVNLTDAKLVMKYCNGELKKF